MWSDMELRKVKKYGYILISSERYIRREMSLGELFVWVSPSDNIVTSDSQRMYQTRKVYWFYGRNDSCLHYLKNRYVCEIRRRHLR